jgi:hypothetical protein
MEPGNPDTSPQVPRLLVSYILLHRIGWVSKDKGWKSSRKEMQKKCESEVRDLSAAQMWQEMNVRPQLGSAC